MADEKKNVELNEVETDKKDKSKTEINEAEMDNISGGFSFFGRRKRSRRDFAFLKM